MIIKPPTKFHAQVEMHLPGGMTRVVLYDIAHGDIRLDLPTEKIPQNLRGIGSKFLATTPQFTVETSDSPEEIRHMCQQALIQELDDANT